MFGQRTETATGWEGLDARTRARLDRFAEPFDEISESDLMLFAGPAKPDTELTRAMETADQVLGTGMRRDATKRAVQAFVHAAQVRFVNRFDVLHLVGVGARSRPSAADRVRVFRSLERAIVALVVWDRLDAPEQAALAGPWRVLVEQAVEDE